MVAIDGVDLRVTPVMRHELAVGNYIVTVTAVGYTVWADTITITLGNEERTRATLRRQHNWVSASEQWKSTESTS